MRDPTPLPQVQALWLTRTLWAQMVKTCALDGHEHGGKALGRIYTDGTVVACAHIDGGPGAVEAPRRFAPDVAYQQACYEGLLGRFPHLRLVLDYHLHPGGNGQLTDTDRHALAELLGEAGWGIEGIAALIVTPATGDAPAELQAHAYWAHRGAEGVEIRSIPLTLIDAGSARVHQLLTPAPAAPRAFITREVAGALRDRVAAEPMLAVDLYGRQRLDEGLLQILALAPGLDLYRIGRFAAPASPPVADGELRVFLEEGGLRASLTLDDRALPVTLEEGALEGGLGARRGSLVEEGLLEEASVLFVGLGSLGSAIAQLLSQSGVGGFTLLDPDRLSPSNLGRHVGDVRDLGRLKTDLMKEKLLARCPGARVRCLGEDVRALPCPAALEAAFAEANLVIVTTDDPVANLAANRIAQEVGVPALFAGAFDGGLGGEIVATDGAGPGCYACVAAFRATLPRLPRASRAHDYLTMAPTDALPPMDGLAVDLGHLAAIAASQALGLLGVGGREPREDHPITLVAGGQPQWIFREPFEVIPCRLAQPGCPVCSPDTHPDPLEDEEDQGEDVGFGEDIPLEAGVEAGPRHPQDSEEAR